MTDSKNVDSIVKVATEIKALAGMHGTELSKRETVDAIVSAALDAQSIAKQAADLYDDLKSQFKRMVVEANGGDETVYAYSFENLSKMGYQVKGGGSDLSETALIKAIYAHYGEPVGKKDGKAWAAFTRISDPVDMPRKLNKGKLEAEMTRTALIEAGVNADDTVYIPTKIVKDSFVKSNITKAAGVSAMTKDEIKDFNAGNLTDPFPYKLKSE